MIQYSWAHEAVNWFSLYAGTFFPPTAYVTTASNVSMVNWKE